MTREPLSYRELTRMNAWRHAPLFLREVICQGIGWAPRCAWMVYHDITPDQRAEIARHALAVAEECRKLAEIALGDA